VFGQQKFLKITTKKATAVSLTKTTGSVFWNTL